MNIKNLIAVAAITASAMVSTHSFAGTNITENVTLTADTDWSGLGVVTVPAGKTVTLNGHNLKVHAIVGAGTLTTGTVMGANAFPDLTSKSEAMTGATASTNGVVVGLAKYPASAAFDNDISTGTSGTASNPNHFLYWPAFSSAVGLDVDYDFGTATNINCYKILGSPTTSYKSIPKAWEFLGSNDGVTWTKLDERSTQLTVGAWKEFVFSNNASYKIYRLHVKSVTGNQSTVIGNKPTDCYIWELQYGVAPYNTLCVDADGFAESDLSGITVAAGVSKVLADSGTLELSADADLSGWTIDGAVDLKGNRLTVDSLGGSFTDTSAGSPGELHVNVASGTVTNSSVSISGNLKLVKEGAGKFVSAIAQTYSGGTLVAAGTLRPHDPPNQDSTTYNGDAVKAFGNGVIAVASNAVFDVRANYAYNKPIRLEGGAFACTGPYNMTKTTWGGSGFNEMTADSTLAISNSLVFQSFGSKCDLGGHKLTVRLLSGYGWYLKKYDIAGYPSLVITNGAIDVVSGGWMQICAPTDARTVDFKINCALKVDNPFSVRDYEARFYSTGSNGGTAQMTVAGVFKPTVAAYYGCTMLAGSTMDLTVWPGAWPMASAFTNGKTNLEFADSGEITVNLAGRDDLKALARSANPYLITWTVKNDAPVVPGADFVLDSATAAAGYRLRKDATGLKVETMRGLIIIFN